MGRPPLVGLGVCRNEIWSSTPARPDSSEEMKIESGLRLAVRPQRYFDRAQPLCGAHVAHTYSGPA